MNEDVTNKNSWVFKYFNKKKHVKSSPSAGCSSGIYSSCFLPCNFLFLNFPTRKVFKRNKDMIFSDVKWSTKCFRCIRMLRSTKNSFEGSKMNQECHQNNLEGSQKTLPISPNFSNFKKNPKCRHFKVYFIGKTDPLFFS